VLNRSQFKEFTANTVSGGDTVHLETGERPTSGYMVSEAGAERRIPADDLHTSDVVHYARDHRDTLSAPDAYMGGWTSEGTSYLDVSRRHAILGEAQAAGVRNNQLAIYDLDHGDEITLQKRTSSIDRMRARHAKRAMLGR
jgi:hypothetical protein